MQAVAISEHKDRIIKDNEELYLPISKESQGDIFILLALLFLSAIYFFYNQIKKTTFADNQIKN